MSAPGAGKWLVEAGCTEASASCPLGAVHLPSMQACSLFRNTAVLSILNVTFTLMLALYIFSGLQIAYCTFAGWSFDYGCLTDKVSGQLSPLKPV